MLQLAMATLVVPDYDQGIEFFVGRMGFQLIEDTALADGKRWVVVAPRPSGAGLLLARAVTDNQRVHIGLARRSCEAWPEPSRPGSRW